MDMGLWEKDIIVFKRLPQQGTLDIPYDVLTNREVRVSLYKNGIGFERK